MKRTYLYHFCVCVCVCLYYFKNVTKELICDVMVPLFWVRDESEQKKYGKKYLICLESDFSFIKSEKCQTFVFRFDFSFTFFSHCNFFSLCMFVFFIGKKQQPDSAIFLVYENKLLQTEQKCTYLHFLLKWSLFSHFCLIYS